MRKNIVLIDFESVQPRSLTLLDRDHFQTYIFVGADQRKVPFELVNASQKMGVKAEYVKISGNGPNALDFHIAYYIGRLAAEYPDAFFHIVSKDKGFDPLIKHLKSNNILSGRWPDIADIPILKAAKTTTPSERAAMFVVYLGQSRIAKPVTRKTLANAIRRYFLSQLSDEEVASAVSALERNHGVKISPAGRVSYLHSETSNV